MSLSRDAAALEAKLLPEPALLVLPSAANAFGLNAAIVLQQVHFRSRITGDGWWRATLSELRAEFSWWSAATIKRVLGELRREQLVEVRQDGVDRANRYRIDYGRLRERVHAGSEVQSAPVDRLTSRPGRADARGQAAPIPIDRKKNSKRAERAHTGDLSQYDAGTRRV